jgi:hypothetical protein
VPLSIYLRMVIETPTKVLPDERRRIFYLTMWQGLTDDDTHFKIIDKIMLGTGAWKKGGELITDKRVAVLADTRRTMLQLYTLGETRYYGAGPIVYKRPGLYNNTIMRIKHPDLEGIKAVLVFDKLRSTIVLDGGILFQSGALWRFCFDFADSEQVMWQDFRFVSQIEYVWCWPRTYRGLIWPER